MSDHFVRDRLPAPDQQPEFLLLDYPQRRNAAAELLKGGKAGDLAVVNALGRWTYGDLDDFSGRIARLLVDEHGLSHVADLLLGRVPVEAGGSRSLRHGGRPARRARAR